MSPRPKANSERTNVFFSPEVMEQLRRLAEKKGTSVSGLIRMIVLNIWPKNKTTGPTSRKQTRLPYQHQTRRFGKFMLPHLPGICKEVFSWICHKPCWIWNR